MKICPKCGTDNQELSKYCLKCGSSLDEEQTIAPFSELPSKDQFKSLATSFAKSSIPISLRDEQRVIASKNFTKVIADINERYVSNMIHARIAYKDNLSIIRSQLTDIFERMGPSVGDWSDQFWRNFNPGSDDLIPGGTRFGTAIFKGHFEEFIAPALVPILNQGNLFFVAKGAAKKKVVQALQSVLLRITATFPAGKLRLILIDPVGLGANVAGFMNLPEQIIGSKAWTEPPQIEQQLADLSAHMENVIQKYLRLDYKSMEEYNHYAGEVAEPYRFLGVINFPANFTDASAKRLVSIASNGPRSGVYLICTIDADLPLPYGFNLADLLRTGSVIEATGNDKFVWKVAELDQLDLVLDTPPPTDQFNRIISPIGELAKKRDRVEVPFGKVMPSKQVWWSDNTSLELKAPLGRRGAREIQYLELGQGTQHYALMAGKPGSGKSTLLHVLIVNLALKYAPEELILYLVDFKKGVEFKDYAEFELPHARVIGIESEREFGLSVLKEIQQEMNLRGDMFRQVNYQDLHTYRLKTKKRLPRILLIVDEFQRLFSEDDRLADEAASILAHIVQQGRAFGIHVLLASQTLADAYAVGRPTYDKMNVRIALQCTEADSRLILGEDNGAARLLSRPGEAVYNALNGLEEGNNFFQVAWLPDEERETYLKLIRKMADNAQYIPESPQIVFEGNIPSRISANTVFWKSIHASNWPETDKAVKVFLGESTEINPPHTTTLIRPQARAGILILGQNERVSYSLISTAWISLCANMHPDHALFFVVDFSRVDDPWAKVLATIKSAVPHNVRLARSGDFRDILFQVEEITNQRIQKDSPVDQKVFLILAGLHRARELRETDQYGSLGETSQAMAHICREGPDLGVHVIAWCDTFGSLTRVLDRRVIPEFDIRIALQMGEDDSNQFIESPKAKDLGPNRAYLYDLDRIGILEKFRPYELVSESELEEIRIALMKKASGR